MYIYWIFIHHSVSLSESLSLVKNSFWCRGIAADGNTQRFLGSKVRFIVRRNLNSQEIKASLELLFFFEISRLCIQSVLNFCTFWGNDFSQKSYLINIFGKFSFSQFPAKETKKIVAVSCS